MSDYKRHDILKEVGTKKKVGIILDSKEYFSSCDDQCPVRMTARIIEGKWTTLIVRELLSGKKRYTEIQKALGSISPKVLTSRLKLLESLTLLTRTVYPTIPPKTEYELTEMGFLLKNVLNEMAIFGNELKKLNPMP